jgi:hypothetical protein
MLWATAAEQHANILTFLFLNKKHHHHHHMAHLKDLKASNAGSLTS